MDNITAAKWMNPTGAAQYAHVSRPTIYRWMRMGGFPVYRVGGCTRIPKDELDAWIIKEGRQNADC